MKLRGLSVFLVPIVAAIGPGRIEAQNVTITTEPSAEPKPDAKAPSLGGPGTSEVRVSSYGTVDIIAQNDDVTNVLQKLAVQARRNIVPSKGVSQRVSATIYGVPFLDALDGLLTPYGLVYRERDDFVFVYTAEEIQGIDDDSRPLLSRVIDLNYLRPDDAKEFAAPLLSPRGSIVPTRDLDSDAGGQAVGDQAGSSVDSEDAVYTPNTDEYAAHNAIIVHDVAAHLDAVEAFIRQVDVEPPQVLIETTIVSTTLSEDNAFGIDFALLTDVNFVDFFNFPVGATPIGLKTSLDANGNILTPTLPSNEGFAISSAGNAGGGPATFRAGGIIGDEVGVFLRALDQITDVSILANPKVLAVNRQRSKILVGTRVGYLETVVVENQVLQSVQFIDTGVALDIRPYILADGRIRLELGPKVSRVTFREVEGLGGITQQIPDEEIQTINTDVMLPDGYTAVIGGLFREDTRNVRSQVPLLGDIPYAGVPFRGEDEQIQQSEVIFLIKATVLKSDQTLIDQGIRGEGYTERVRVGSRLGLLPWSRERQSACLNLAAERNAAAGDYDRALWNIRRSLELHPIQPDALRIREQLVNGPAWWPSRSYLERTIDAEFHHQLDLDKMDPTKREDG